MLPDGSIFGATGPARRPIHTRRGAGALASRFRGTAGPVGADSRTPEGSGRRQRRPSSGIEAAGRSSIVRCRAGSAGRQPRNPRDAPRTARRDDRVGPVGTVHDPPCLMVTRCEAEPEPAVDQRRQFDSLGPSHCNVISVRSAPSSAILPPRVLRFGHCTTGSSGARGINRPARGQGGGGEGALGRSKVRIASPARMAVYWFYQAFHWFVGAPERQNHLPEVHHHRPI